MANNVSSYISFSDISEEAEDWLDKLMPDYNTSAYEVLGKIYDKTEEEMDNWEWWNENVGSKWLNFEDVSCGGVSTVSAWSPPTLFYENLYKKLSSLNSPDLKMWARYDDEMPNFVGVWGMAPDGYDYDEYIDEEYYEQCIDCLPYAENEDGDYESVDEWWDKFDEWSEKEYGLFIEGYAEHLEEMKEE
jgi:hypothetical protein